MAFNASTKEEKTNMRYQPILKLIWNDDRFPHLKEDVQLTWFHVMTTPMSNQLGIYKASMAALADEKGIPVEQYRKRFLNGSHNGLFHYDDRTKTVYVPNYLKYNQPSNPNQVQGWGKVFQELPESPMKAAFWRDMESLCASLDAASKKSDKPFTQRFTQWFPKPLSEPFTKPLPQGLPEPLPQPFDQPFRNQEQEQEQEQYQEQYSNRPPADASDRHPVSQNRGQVWPSVPEEWQPHHYTVEALKISGIEVTENMIVGFRLQLLDWTRKGHFNVNLEKRFKAHCVQVHRGLDDESRIEKQAADEARAATGGDGSLPLWDQYGYANEQQFIDHNAALSKYKSDMTLYEHNPDVWDNPPQEPEDPRGNFQ